MEPVTIRRAERDALWQLVHMLLASISDIFTAVDAGKVNEARMLRYRYRDLMRLFDDIGWSFEGPGTEFAITMDPEALMRALARLHKRAIDLIYEPADGRPIDPQVLQMAVIGASACDTILTQLAHAPACCEAS
jgi:hypothetical protein